MPRERGPTHVVTDFTGREWTCYALPHKAPHADRRVLCFCGEKRVELRLPFEWHNVHDEDVAVLIQGAERRRDAAP